MFLAWYSPAALQAAVPAGILFFTMVCGFMAVAAFANSFVAQYYGSGNLHGCSRSVAQAILLAVGSWPLIWLLIPVGLLLLNAGGHAPEVLAQERIYFSILMIGGVYVPLMPAVGSFFSGRGKTRVIMICILIETVVNLILNWILIFGAGPIPALGTAGAAIASMMAGFTAPLLMLGLYFSRKNDRLYATRRLFYLDGPLFRRLLRFGVPSGIHMVLNIGSFSMFVMLLGRLGDTALTAANIALSVNMIAFMPAVGIGQAAGTLTGQHLGRRDFHGAAVCGWRAVHLGWIFAGLAALSFVLMPDVYIRLFAQSDALSGAVFPTARRLLRFAAGWGLLNATNLILAGALRGAGDTRFVMWYQTSVAWLIFGAGELLIVLVLGGGVTAAWSWALIYITLLAAGMALRFRSGRWQEIELIDRHEPPAESTEGLPVA